MKRWETIVCLVVLAWAVSGCAGLHTAVPGPEMRAEMTLDQWLETRGFPEIIALLKTDPFLKGRDFIIVKPHGEQISPRIDRLTHLVRDRLEDRILEERQLHMVVRHPVKPIDRPYRLQEQHCGSGKNHELLVTIDIRPVAPKIVKVSIRAMDEKKGRWIRGVSVHTGALRISDAQAAALNDVHSDQKLKGLRYLPFDESEQDLMAGYLARNLSCIFLNHPEAYDPDRKILAYVNSQQHGKEGSIVKMLRHQLNFCNQIRVVSDPAMATCVIDVASVETGKKGDLCQLWVETKRIKGKTLIKGMTTYAYYSRGIMGRAGLAGRWEILRIEDGRRMGFMEVGGKTDREQSANLLGPDGQSLEKRGIFINRRGDDVDWAYFDEKDGKTMEVRGVVSKDGTAMNVKTACFPSSSQPEAWKLVLME